jgi:ubiquinone/menaquinone biosynthesis C-methylase UbiE
MSHLSWLTKLYVFACQKLYYELAWTYDWVSWLISFGRWPKWRLHALHYLSHPDQHNQQPYRLLEIGFGTGELLVHLTKNNFAAYGLELSPTMVGITAQKLDRAKLPVRCAQGRTEAMPFADAFFHTIIATFPTSFILDPATLTECTRLLPGPGSPNCAQGGTLIVVGLSVDLKPNWLQYMLPLFYGTPSPAFCQLVKNHLAEAGFAAKFTSYQDGCFVVSVIIAQKV